MSTTSGRGQPQGSTGEAEETSIHPEDLPVLITFSSLFCASGTCTAQVTVSGLLSRGQYTIGIELQALLLEGPTIIFQDFRTICGALDSSQCRLPHNSTGTSTSPSALKATHLTPNGEATLTYDLPVLGDGAHRCTVMVVDARNSINSLDSLGLRRFTFHPALAPTPRTWTVVVTVSRGYANMFENWLYFFKLLALDMQVLLIAEDETTFKMYGARNDIVTRAGRFQDPASENASESKGFSYGTLAFRNLVSNRPGYILEVMKSYPNVLYTDVDTVWLADPRPFLAGEYDVWTSLDEEHGNYRVYCTGFMAFLPTQQSVSVLKMWDAELSKKPDLNQPVWNRLLGRSKVKVGAMPMQLFPYGIMYFGVSTLASLAYLRSLESNASVVHVVPWTDRVVVVHNNWITDKKVKVQRFKDSGLWKVIT